MALSAPEVVSLSTLVLGPVILIYPPYQSHPIIQQCCGPRHFEITGPVTGAEQKKLALIGDTD
eukprot:13017992-Ditylum_brightwellii.AAC.1